MAASHMGERVVVDAFRPQSMSNTAVFDALAIGGGILFVALTAQLTTTLPFFEIAVQWQVFGVLCTGFALGARRGMLALALYILLGTLGLPIFDSGHNGGDLLLSNLGFYLGYLLAAGVLGWLAEQEWDQHPLWTLGAFTLGYWLIYLVGFPWVALFSGLRVLSLLNYPAVVMPNILFSGIAAFLFPLLWKIATKRGK